jgi:CRP-like cAMP-binding protein
MSTTFSRTTANRLLGAISRQAYRRIFPQLQPVELAYGQILYEPDGPIGHVYFPIDCLVSLLTTVDARRRLEVGMIGNEGMVGVPISMGFDISSLQALVQGSGLAMRLTAAHFRAEFKINLPLQRALSRYTHGLICQVSQTAACNRFHLIDARLARWLLMTADRVHADQFHLTHEFLADMLGVRRVGVTEAASNLEKKGLIDYVRGNIAILDRQGLEDAACSCYRFVRNLEDRAQRRGLL